uniref:hypothetical protein n=1 Tax=Klebsiella pneumoniae TaxID=573 RepID=UPI002AE03233
APDRAAATQRYLSGTLIPLMYVNVRGGGLLTLPPETVVARLPAAKVIPLINLAVRSATGGEMSAI